MKGTKIVARILVRAKQQPTQPREAEPPWRLIIGFFFVLYTDCEMI
jgi:hypothetical protein